MDRYVITTKIEDGGVLGFGKRPANPADYDDKQKEQMANDVAEIFLQKGLDSGQFPKDSKYRIVANSLETGKMTTTIEIV